MKILLFLIVFSLFQPKEYSGKIIHVMDGDTFVLQTNEGNLKIRMDGIDAPEKNQPYGEASKQFLEGYLYKNAKVVYKDVDRYGRTIGLLYIDGVNICLLSLQKGLAWHYKKYSSDMALADAENIARNNKIGLWKDPSPIAPWEWRKMK